VGGNTLKDNGAVAAEGTVGVELVPEARAPGTTYIGAVVPLVIDGSTGLGAWAAMNGFESPAASGVELESRGVVNRGVDAATGGFPKNGASNGFEGRGCKGALPTLPAAFLTQSLLGSGTLNAAMYWLPTAPIRPTPNLFKMFSSAGLTGAFGMTESLDTNPEMNCC
jgi:hypothetical protein